jgi:hypothetical protein
MTKEKTKEIKRLLRRGVPEGEVKEDLKALGYTEKEMEHLFQPHKYDMRSWYLCFAILVFLAGSWVAITKGSFLLLILSALLALAYFKETERLKKQ